MAWLELEALVVGAFGRNGCWCLGLGGVSPNSGLDLVQIKSSEKFRVQCKQWKAFKVGVDVVRVDELVKAATGRDMLRPPISLPQ